jgi:5-methylcytosine-specific restriction endonuclease McrA
MVLVLDRRKHPLMPCTEKRARLLLMRGRAVVHRRYPFTIRLKDRLAEESTFHTVVLKLDPGSKTTGLALVREEPSVEGPIHHALLLGQIHHRGEQVRERLRQRAAHRRRRRGSNLRHRAARFQNRRRPLGWLAPSLQSRVDNVLQWAQRVARLAPVLRVEVEAVRFDTQALQDPEIAGVEYQQGELFGCEVREYLLQKWGWRCAYCGGARVPLQIEHIVPKSRRGSDRVSNLTIACRACNERKGMQTAEEFGHAEVKARAQAPLQHAAIVNATRAAIASGLCRLELQVRSWSGGRTKWNRSRFGIPKTHALDALCVGELAGVTGVKQPVLGIRARGRGQRRRTNTDAFGFPRGYRIRQKRVHGLSTGDLVRAKVPVGKQAGTHVGRITVRAIGWFRIGRVDGIAWRHCRLLARGDGYEYERGEGGGVSSPHLKVGATGAA